MVPIFTPGPAIFSLWIKADGRSRVMPRQHLLSGSHRRDSESPGAFGNAGQGRSSPWAGFWGAGC